MRSSLIALTLLLSGTAYAADAPAPAGDTPSAESKAEAAKPNPDQVKASVEEDEHPVKRSISLRGGTLSYTVTPGHLTIRNDEGEPTVSMMASDGGVSGRMELGEFHAGRLRANLENRTIVLDGGTRLKIMQGKVR